MKNMKNFTKSLTLALCLISFLPITIFCQTEISIEAQEVPAEIIETFNQIKKELNIEDTKIRHSTRRDYIKSPLFKYAAYSSTENTVVVNSKWLKSLSPETQRLALTLLINKIVVQTQGIPVGTKILLGYSLAYTSALAAAEIFLWNKLSKHEHTTGFKIGAGILLALAMRISTIPLLNKVAEYSRKKTNEEIQKQYLDNFLKTTQYKAEEVLSYYEILSAAIEKENNNVDIEATLEIIDFSRSLLNKLL